MTSPQPALYGQLSHWSRTDILLPDLSCCFGSHCIHNTVGAGREKQGFFFLCVGYLHFNAKSVTLRKPRVAMGTLLSAHV